MTIGQRIAQRRKELGLSQEALGERMGVSRQAIYKWESDAALPEIEKLVMLSQLFGVRVGWLLGVEDEAETVHGEQEELTPVQLKMVEEIARRYIRAIPQPKPRRKWPWVLGACVAALVLINLFSEMDQLNSRYNNLQNAVGSISNSVNMQVNGIAGRVEEILKAQNDLTAEYGTETISTDYRTGQITVKMTAVPKTYVREMQAEFVVDTGTGPVAFAGVLADGRTFSAEATVPLTDKITMSVVFVGPDGTRQTQLLDTYMYLLSDSYGDYSIDGHALWDAKIKHGKLSLSNVVFHTRQLHPGKGGEGITECKLGLFRNQKLIGWAEAIDRPANYQGFDDSYQFFKLTNILLEDLEPGDLIMPALMVTDGNGRTYMVCDSPYEVQDDQTLGYPDVISYDRDPSKWILE